jgi:hypothetical protein
MVAFARITKHERRKEGKVVRELSKYTKVIR